MSRIVLFVVILIPSVILHEVAHGLAALAFGDDTAKQAGRLTLNPVPHIDPFGTLLLPAILAFSGAGVFGWAKPVPVNPYRMRRPRDHGLLVSLAGPATNIVLALLAAFALRTLTLSPNLEEIFLDFGVVNVILAAFNLLPVPPLDGSALVERILPRQWLPGWLKLRQYSMGIVVVLVLLLPGVLGPVFRFALSLWSVLLPRGA